MVHEIFPKFKRSYVSYLATSCENMRGSRFHALILDVLLIHANLYVIFQMILMKYVNIVTKNAVI